MKTIRGDQAGPKLKADILRAFVHRWTHENAVQTYGGKCPGCCQAGTVPRHAAPRGEIGRRYTEKEWHAHHTPLISDAEWLATHSFHITAQGELSKRHNYAEPAYMADCV